MNIFDFNTTYLPIILPFLLVLCYKLSFWLYVIQLKEYRWDRFKEYMQGKQGRSALCNFWFIIELVLLLVSFTLLFDSQIEILYYPIVFVFFVLQSIFVIGKILRRRLLLPKMTGRLCLTIIFSGISMLIIALILLTTGSQFVLYSTIFLSLMFTPFIVFLSIFTTIPIVSRKKKNKINSAIKKSKNITSPKKVAITGSYGKSSVKTYLNQILSSKYNTLSTPENINTELGVSGIVLNKLNKEHDYFVAEAGAYKKGEISLLGDIINHKDGFLTGIGTQHLGLFGSQENIKQGKFEILEKVIQNKGKLYVNYDNAHIRDYLDENNIELSYIIKYSLQNKDADIHSQITEIKNAITHFNVFYNDEKYEFKTTLIGNHNILNLCGVIAYCFDTGMSYEEIQKGLNNVTAPKNTLEVHRQGKTILIDDSYNLSEDGLFAGLDAAQSFGKDIPIHLILDDILELGKDAEKKHSSIAVNIVKNYNIKSVLFTGKNYKESFKKGLIDANAEELLINKIEEGIEEKSETEVIYLFEGRGAGMYFKKIKK